MTTSASPIETALKHDRIFVVAGLAGITLLSWLYILSGPGMGMSPFEMTRLALLPHLGGDGLALEGLGGMALGAWSAGYWLIMLLMWWIMMIAMMTPSAAPMILLYGRVLRHGQKQGRIKPMAIPTATFAGGYLIAWLGLSLLATVLQWGFEKSGLVSAMMMWSTSASLTSGLLIAAGLYQLSRLKHICLKHCRMPADFLSRHWRDGKFGAFRMGVAHGAYCVGCCWFLMGLLFTGGVMNLLWIAGLTALVLLEKLALQGQWVARGTGALLTASGLFLLVQAYTA